HLDKGEAKKLLARAIKSYADEHRQHPPTEIFIHGSARFKEEEWAGFEEAAKEAGTKVVGIRIRRVYGGLRLFTRGTGAVMRGPDSFGKESISVHHRFRAAPEYLSGVECAKSIRCGDLQRRGRYQNGSSGHPSPEQAELQQLQVCGWISDHAEICWHGWGHPHHSAPG